MPAGHLMGLPDRYDSAFIDGPLGIIGEISWPTTPAFNGTIMASYGGAPSAADIAEIISQNCPQLPSVAY